MQQLTFDAQAIRRPEAFTLLCQLTPLSLAKARAVGQRVLAQQLVTLTLPEDTAHQVCAQARSLGVAGCRCQPSSTATAT